MNAVQTSLTFSNRPYTQAYPPVTHHGTAGKWHRIGDRHQLQGYTRDQPVMRAELATGTTTTASKPATLFPDDVVFDQLVAQWRRERGATSSITAMAMAPSYQRIIAMGERAIPLILRSMEREGDEPDMWFWALRILTLENPVPAEASGDIVAMAKAWLDWGRSRYAW